MKQEYINFFEKIMLFNLKMKYLLKEIKKDIKYE